ncbi:MAG: CCA tRNA nucleotidyltransferase [Alphaproteobacteria bacterium]|nr:CCA tRNA nucleotidyltransferase [Alphaproteobacteria bacterium]
MTPAGRLDRRDWLEQPPLRRVLAALGAAEGLARPVGGCVRDALLGRPVRDVDIATSLDPKEVTRRLDTAGIKAVPTGLKHGTVTAVADGVPFEITTLRRDVATDGRHATVAFVDDWLEDARRRDFTMNALYCDGAGTLFDPTGEGLADARAGRVRFVGDPARRIAEDGLRLLRFFRFQAHYGSGPPDNAGRSAAIAASAMLDRLSGERIRQEILRLLEAPDPAPVLRDMEAAGVLSKVLPGTNDIVALGALVAAENRLGDVDALRRLAALRGGTPIEALIERLKLSNAEADRLRLLTHPPTGFSGRTTAAEIQAAIYRLGNGMVRDLILLSPARCEDGFLRLAREWRAPAFPLAGADVLACGIAPGPRVGKLLQELEGWWISRDFAPDRAALVARLREFHGRGQG